MQHVARNRNTFYFLQHVAANFKGCHGNGCENNYEEVCLKFLLLKMAACTGWTANKIERLIQLLEERPCLYNTKDKFYYDREMRGKAVSEISNLLEISGKA